jgi:SNF2 family DNA or RNA helicase
MSDLLRANEEADEEFVDDEEDVTTRTAFRAEQPLTRADALSKLEELLNKATAYTNFLEAQMINENNSEPAKRAKTTKLVQPKLVTGGTMKPYQLEGVRWLTGLWENGLNGILADDMGLGKTIQTIALLAHLRELKVYAWRILVVPLSTMTNWMAELQKWAPSVPAMQYHGDKEERVALRKRMAQIKKSEDKSRIPVLVTTYEVVCRDRRDLQVLNLDWKHLIVDEGHRLKNRHCRLIKELNMLVGTRDALNHGCSKLLLTGTPLQNDITELWSLLNFLLPQVFDNLRFFQDVFEFDDPLAAEREQNIVSKLHRILRPFMLRRLKTQVEQDLPPKLEVVVYCNMTDGQRELYEAIRQGELKSLLEQAGASASSYQNVIMQLRKAANHPYLHFDPTEASQVTDRSLVRCAPPRSSAAATAFPELTRPLGDLLGQVCGAGRAAAILARQGPQNVDLQPVHQDD